MEKIILALIIILIIALSVVALAVIIIRKKNDRVQSRTAQRIIERDISVDGAVDIDTGKRINTSENIFKLKDKAGLSTIYLDKRGEGPRHTLSLTSLTTGTVYRGCFRKEITIGRVNKMFNDGNLVISGDSLVSSSHCKVFEDGGYYFVIDLGSRNKTYLNGKIVTGVEQLRGGDQLTIGGSVYSISFSNI